MPLAYIGIGANLGDARAAVLTACNAIARLPATTLQAASSLYSSAPIDSHGDDYVNAVVCVNTALGAHELLAHLQALERAAGRERPYINAPRTLDLDVLIYGGEQINTPTLSVPHPRLHQRAFVLAPLAEIAPNLVIDGLGAVAALLPSVAKQQVKKLATQLPTASQ